MPLTFAGEQILHAASPTVVKGFELRCWARGYLEKYGMMPLQEAVDGLQDLAVDTGLVDMLGQDAVQAIMANAFEFQQEGTEMDAPAKQAGASGSYRASKQRPEQGGAAATLHRPDRGANEPPPPKSLPDYGLSPDSATVPYEPPPATPAAEPPKAPAAIRATPYTWIAPTTIPRRDFVYGRHLIRKFVSATVAPGGIGKSSLVITEALAMVSGKDLLGVHPSGRSRVWLWNLEDPAEEIARHVQATASHYRLKPEDLEGYLFIDSGRDQRLVIAVTDRNGTVILQPIVDSLVEELIRRQIDVLIIDPFVSSHEAPENDNGAMDRIVKEWGRVAQRANCAIELVHHSRKSSAGETEITVEAARGGKALTDGCRSVRVLNRMSKEEGENAGVDKPRLHFRTFIDKANLAPPAESSTWFKLESVDLGNGSNGIGDSVGVVVPWQWPDLLADVTVRELRAVQAIANEGRYRASPQAEDWVGKAVAEALRLDLAKPADKRKAKNLIKIWLESGALKKVEEKDDKGMSRPFVIVGEWAND
jgi:hypothetical protein